MNEKDIFKILENFSSIIKLYDSLSTRITALENANKTKIINKTTEDTQMSKKEYSQEEIQNANDEISKLVDAAYESIANAQKLADKYKLDFSFNLAYGMGGWYNGDEDERYGDDDEGWSASSQSC